MNDTHLLLTVAALQRSTDLHLQEIIAEIGTKSEIIGPITSKYVDEILQGMVTRGSSPDVILYGWPEAVEKFEKEVLREASRRWQLLLKTLRIEEKPGELPEKIENAVISHGVNFPTDHFDKRFNQTN